MRALRGPFLWLAAGWAAATVLLRIARGEVVILSDHAAPVVRLVALAIVFLSGCAEKLRPAAEEQPQDLSPGTGERPAGEPGSAGGPGPEPGGPEPAGGPEPTAPEPAAPPTSAQEFPAGLDDDALYRMYAFVEPRGLWRRFVLAAEAGRTGSAEQMRLPRSGDPEASRRFAAEVEAHVARERAGQPETAATLTALLDAAEALPLYDGWLAARLWQRARTLRPAPAGLLGRLERHLRVVHALVLAQASVGPVEFTAWRSKAGPPPGFRGHPNVPAGMADAARKAFVGGADAGTWESEAALRLTVARGEVTLVRRGAEVQVPVGTALRLRRLDVVRAPAGAALRHATLGELTLPAGGELTAWTAGEFVSAEARAWTATQVAAAMRGESAALAELERVLPAVHAAIRAALASKPEQPGAAGLRMLLEAFDE